MSSGRRVAAALMLLIGSAGPSASAPSPVIRVPFDEPVPISAPGTRPAAHPAALQSTQSVGNVRVNDPILAPAGAPDFNPVVAAIGSKVLTAWNVRGTVNTQRIQAAFSENGGASWTAVGWLPALPGDWRWGTDACLASDPVTNTFFLAAQCASLSLNQQGIWVITAQINGGITWGTPSLARTHGNGGSFFGDQLEINFDPASVSLDLVFHDGESIPNVLAHQVSWNRGATWSAPTTILTDPTGFLGISPRVAWTDFGPLVMANDVANWDQLTIRTRRSSSTGTWDPPVTVNQIRVDGSTLPGTVDLVSGTALAVDRTFNRFQGMTYAAWVASFNYASWPTPSGNAINESEPNDTPAQANSLNGVGWFSGAFSPQADVEYGVISLQQGQRLVVRTTAIQTAGQNFVSPTVVVDVIAADGVHSLGQTSLDLDNIANAKTLFTAPRTSTYYLRLTGFNALSYQLSISIGAAGPPQLDRRDLYVCRSSNYGGSWGFPSVLAYSAPGFDVANPTMVVGNDGRPYLFWQDWDAGDPDGARMRVQVARSSDGGSSWEGPQTITTSITDWQGVAPTSFKTGWRLGAATTPTNLGEPLNARGPERVASPARATSENYDERVHVVWTDGRDDQGNIYSASFPTGFVVAYRTTDTTCAPGEYLGLRMALENHNPLFQQWIDTPEPFCTRNWQSIHGSMIWPPGESSSTTPYVVVVPDTAAAGTVFFQGSIELGPTSYGLNTFIHVVPPTGVPGETTPLSFAAPSPNPAATFSSFRFGLPRAGEASLEIFDVNGARVRTLVSGPCAAGPNARGWDLRDDNGGTVATGVYLARLTVGNWSRTQRLAVVR